MFKNTKHILIPIFLLQEEANTSLEPTEHTIPPTLAMPATINILLTHLVVQPEVSIPILPTQLSRAQWEVGSGPELKMRGGGGESLMLHF